MANIIAKFKLDIELVFLMMVTLNIWYFKVFDYKFGFLIYLLIFIYLIIKKKPIYQFIIVILFSVMSEQKVNIFIMDSVLVMILFFYTVIINIKNKYFVMGNLFIPLIIYFIYNVISILWTPNKSDGIQGIFNLLEGYEIYYIITNGRFKIAKENFLAISKIATYVMLTLSLEIFYTYYINGFEKVLNSKLMVDLGWGVSNFISVIFVLLLPIALFKYLDKKYWFIFYFLLDLINLLGLTLTLSRGAIVGAFFSLVLFIVFFVRKHFIQQGMEVFAY